MFRLLTRTWNSTMCEPGPFQYISYEEFQLLTFKNPGTSVNSTIARAGAGRPCHQTCLPTDASQSRIWTYRIWRYRQHHRGCHVCLGEGQYCSQATTGRRYRIIGEQRFRILISQLHIPHTLCRTYVSFSTKTIKKPLYSRQNDRYTKWGT